MSAIMPISVQTSCAYRHGQWFVIVTEEYPCYNKPGRTSYMTTRYVDANNRSHAESLSNEIMNESKVLIFQPLAA